MTLGIWSQVIQTTAILSNEIHEGKYSRKKISKKKKLAMAGGGVQIWKWWSEKAFLVCVLLEHWDY